MRLSVVKQSFFGPPGQYGLVTRANDVKTAISMSLNKETVHKLITQIYPRVDVSYS